MVREVLKNYLISVVCYGMKMVELFCEKCCKAGCGILVERKLDWKLIWLDVLLIVRGVRKMLLTGLGVKLLVFCCALGRLIRRPDT